VDAITTESGRTLWVKRDDRASTRYGGSKVRKLEYALGRARAEGAHELVTLGAVGSHHVLATTLHGVDAGFSVRAWLVPQPWNPHAQANISAAVAAGLVARPTREAALPFRVAGWRMAQRFAHLHKGAYYIELGGSDLDGAYGCMKAARELALQIQRGECPMPDWLVVGFGSSGTAAGLAVGLAREGLPIKVRAVCISRPRAVLATLARRLVWGLSRELNLDAHDAWRRLVIDDGYVGRGYGWPIDRGAIARDVAARSGLAVESTYTEKAFCAALDLAETGARVLYWHTLSAGTWPLPASLPPEIDRLLLR
jgi:1-aminocyclopropane-1-carboxylate deaminase/D-cysteine desulfhydrase-like pyridoxal-dependent ACC family enzyme